MVNSASILRGWYLSATGATADMARRHCRCGERLLADKSYKADAIRKELADVRVEAVIPAKATRHNPAPHE